MTRPSTNQLYDDEYSTLTHVKFVLFLDDEMKISQKELSTSSTCQLYYSFSENSRNLHFCAKKIYSVGFVQCVLVAYFSSILWVRGHFLRVFVCVGTWLGMVYGFTAALSFIEAVKRYRGWLVYPSLPPLPYHHGDPIPSQPITRCLNAGESERTPPYLKIKGTNTGSSTS